MDNTRARTPLVELCRRRRAFYRPEVRRSGTSRWLQDWSQALKQLLMVKMMHCPVTPGRLATRISPRSDFLGTCGFLLRQGMVLYFNFPRKKVHVVRLVFELQDSFSAAGRNCRIGGFSAGDSTRWLGLSCYLARNRGRSVGSKIAKAPKPLAISQNGQHPSPYTLVGSCRRRRASYRPAVRRSGMRRSQAPKPAHIANFWPE